jgi:hypothetical protein
LLHWADRRDLRMLALSGLLFGMGVACKQDYGAAALITFVATIVMVNGVTRASGSALPRRESLIASLAVFVAPASLLGAGLGFYYWQAGLLGDLLQFTVFQHFAGMAAFEYTEFPPLLPLFVQDPALRGPIGTEAFIPGILATVDFDWLGSDLFQNTAWVDTALKTYYYAPYLIVPAFGIGLWRQRHALKDPARSGSIIAAFSLWCLATTLFCDVSLNRPQDFLHLAVVYWPMLLLVLCAVAGWLSGRRGLSFAVAVVCVVPAVLIIEYTGKLALGLRQAHPTRIDLPRAQIHATPEQARTIEEIVAFVEERTEPGDTVAAVPYFPLILFYADRAGPHRSSYILWPVPEIPNREEEIIQALEDTETDLVLHNINVFWGLGTMDGYVPVLFDHLVENFRIERMISHHHDYAMAAAVRSSEDHRGRFTPMQFDQAPITLVSGDAPPYPIPPGDRDDYVRLGQWPFRPTLALKPEVGRRTVLSVSADVGPGDRLQTAVGVHPNHWYRIPNPTVTYRIDVVSGDVRQTVYEHALDPMERIDDLGWFEVDVPLGAWAGKTVQLEFSTETDRLTGQSLFMGGWETPRIVNPSETGVRS